MAFQDLVSEYEGLLRFDSFNRIYLPHQTASQIADGILSPETQSRKKEK